MLKIFHWIFVCVCVGRTILNIFNTAMNMIVSSLFWICVQTGGLYLFFPEILNGPRYYIHIHVQCNIKRIYRTFAGEKVKSERIWKLLQFFLTLSLWQTANQQQTTCKMRVQLFLTVYLLNDTDKMHRRLKFHFNLTKNWVQNDLNHCVLISIVFQIWFIKSNLKFGAYIFHIFWI